MNTNSTINNNTVTNADIKYRLDLLKCCVAQQGVNLSNKLKIGQPCEDLILYTEFSTAFLKLFRNYNITEAINGVGFLDNPCVQLVNFNTLVDFVNNLVGTCGICFSPWGTNPSINSFNTSFNTSFL